MAMGNRKRLEILLVCSILANCSFLFVQIFKVNDESKLKSKIEILQTLHSNGKGEAGFQQNVQVGGNFQVNELEGKKGGIETVKSTPQTEKTETSSVDNGLNLNSEKDIESPREAANETMKEFCPEGGEKLEGQKKVNVKQLTDTVHFMDGLSIENGGTVEFGGWWEPKHCKPRVKVAIMLPFRNRELQLQVFLMHMHPIFQRQLLSYRIFVIEQTGVTAWNKGSIYNIGFEKTRKINDFDCYIFHDIDLLAENDKNYYGCPFTPAHMSVAVDTLKYKLPYSTIFGGVEAFSAEEYRKINGFSNMYWGWGGEDDDLYTRVVHKGYKLFRPPADVARYTMNQLNHFRSDGKNFVNQKMYHDIGNRRKRIGIDGLNRISSLKYTYRVTEEPLFTRIAIDLRRSRELKI